MNSRKTGWLILIPGLILMTLLFVVPLIVTLRYSFYKFTPGQFMTPGWVFDSYRSFVADPFNRQVLLGTLWLGVRVVVITALLGYPVAYLLARYKFRMHRLASVAIVIPLLTSEVVTSFGWIVILSNTGLLNTVLLRLGLIHSPIKLMFNETGVIVALVQALLPFMIMSIRSSLTGLDHSLEEAAQSLGADPFTTFLRVTLPLSLPGVFAGSLLVFIGSISAFVTPMLLGGGRIQTLASMILTDIDTTLNWPLAAASSVVLLIVTGVLLWGYKRVMESRLLGGGGRA